VNCLRIFLLQLLIFTTLFTGRADATSESKASIFDDILGTGPLSTDPAAKSAWGLYRAAPDQVNGPIPLILIAGTNDPRWEDFIHWASYSSEAAELRHHYQIWDYRHPFRGVDVAVGFSRDYPAFDESMVAYLDRSIRTAETAGVETDGTRYYFPEGPYAIFGHCHGGLVARAFLANFPEHAQRVLAVISVNGPHLGTPIATREWVSCTLSNVGLGGSRFWGKALDATLVPLLYQAMLSTDRQCDMDMGWANYDAESGFGLPETEFSVFREWRIKHLTLSPRDANRTEARDHWKYADSTFVPQQRLSTYCGGLDAIMPAQRGALGLDKFFLYGSYQIPGDGVVAQYMRNSHGVQSWLRSALETVGMALTHELINMMPSASEQPHLSPYILNDALVPLQSMLMLDGSEGDLVYETRTVDGQRVPNPDYIPRMDLINAHTLANPDRIRILRGWNHLETVTGRYDKRSGSSALFSMISDDLISMLP